MLDGEDFKIRSYVEMEAHCKNCGNKLYKPFSLFSMQVILVCLECESVYELKLVKVANNRIDKDDLKEVINMGKKKRKNNESK